jgi:hypothetical protein
MSIEALSSGPKHIPMPIGRPKQSSKLEPSKPEPKSMGGVGLNPIPKKEWSAVKDVKNNIVPFPRKEQRPNEEQRPEQRPKLAGLAESTKGLSGAKGNVVSLDLRGGRGDAEQGLETNKTVPDGRRPVANKPVANNNIVPFPSANNPDRRPTANQNVDDKRSDQSFKPESGPNSASPEAEVLPTTKLSPEDQNSFEGVTIEIDGRTGKIIEIDNLSTGNPELATALATVDQEKIKGQKKEAISQLKELPPAEVRKMFFDLKSTGKNSEKEQKPENRGAEDRPTANLPTGVIVGRDQPSQESTTSTLEPTDTSLKSRLNNLKNLKEVGKVKASSLTQTEKGTIPRGKQIPPQPNNLPPSNGGGYQPFDQQALPPISPQRALPPVYPQQVLPPVPGPSRPILPPSLTPASKIPASRNIPTSGFLPVLGPTISTAGNPIVGIELGKNRDLLLITQTTFDFGQTYDGLEDNLKIVELDPNWQQIHSQVLQTIFKEDPALIYELGMLNTDDDKKIPSLEECLNYISSLSQLKPEEGTFLDLATSNNYKESLYEYRIADLPNRPASMQAYKEILNRAAPWSQVLRAQRELVQEFTRIANGDVNKRGEAAVQVLQNHFTDDTPFYKSLRQWIEQKMNQNPAFQGMSLREVLQNPQILQTNPQLQDELGRILAETLS